MLLFLLIPLNVFGLLFFFFLIHLLLMNKDFDICYNIFWSYLFLTLFIDVFLLSCIEVL